MNLTLELSQLKEKVSTIILGTKDLNNEVLVSYSPYIEYNNEFYILVSKTAPHYENLMHNQKITGLLIESEEDAKSIYARKRITYHLVPTQVEVNESIQSLFKEQALVQQLLQMDFVCFKLTKLDALAVLGFGKAYSLNDAEEQVEHIGINTNGHSIEK